MFTSPPSLVTRCFSISFSIQTFLFGLWVCLKIGYPQIQRFTSTFRINMSYFADVQHFQTHPNIISRWLYPILFSLQFSLHPQCITMYVGFISDVPRSFCVCWWFYRLSPLNHQFWTLNSKCSWLTSDFSWINLYVSMDKCPCSVAKSLFFMLETVKPRFSNVPTARASIPAVAFVAACTRNFLKSQKLRKQLMELKK